MRYVLLPVLLTLSACQITPEGWRRPLADQPLKDCMDPKTDAAGLATWVGFEDWYDGTLSMDAFIDPSDGSVREISDQFTGEQVTIDRPAGTGQGVLGAPNQLYGMMFGTDASRHPDFTEDRAGLMTIYNHAGLDFGKGENFTVDFWFRHYGCATKGAVRRPQCDEVEIVHQFDPVTKHYWSIKSKKGSGLFFESFGNQVKLTTNVAPFDKEMNSDGKLVSYWVHYAFVVNSGFAVQVYRNGVPYGEVPIGNWEADFGSGHHVYVNGYGQSGTQVSANREIFDLDEFEIFKSALSDDQIGHIYRAGKCKRIPPRIPPRDEVLD